MTVKQLKRMISEEYSKYLKEQEVSMDMPGMPSLDVGADDINVGENEDPEAILKDIYDMLKDYFEGDDKPAASKPSPKSDKEDDKDEDEDEDDKDALDEDDKDALQERFKKLANIIKG